MYDVVALGELLVDFIQDGSSRNGNPVFEANPGGAREGQEGHKDARAFPVVLRSVDKVKGFVDDMGQIEGDVLLSVGKYVIDAKSIMGIFSLDLSNPLQLEIEDWKEEYAPIVGKYLHP